MKKNIHPKYYDKVAARCACGASFSVGATQEKIEVEICSRCHPFYTGKQTLIDTARRAEKFTARRRRAETYSSKTETHRAKAKLKTAKKQKNAKTKKHE